MTAEEKRELANEFFENMDLTKEQYLELCKLVDELELEKYKPVPNWDEIEEIYDNSSIEL